MKMSEQEMTAALVMHGLEIVRLSASISVQNLAHAHIHWHGHTQEFTAMLQPADTKYVEGVKPTVVARLTLITNFYDWWNEEEKAEEFQLRIVQANDYIRQLQAVLDNRQPVLEQEAA